jgi:hypothetical protein
MRRTDCALLWQRDVTRPTTMTKQPAGEALVFAHLAPSLGAGRMPFLTDTDAYDNAPSFESGFRRAPVPISPPPSSRPAVLSPGAFYRTSVHRMHFDLTESSGVTTCRQAGHPRFLLMTSYSARFVFPQSRDGRSGAAAAAVVATAHGYGLTEPPRNGCGDRPCCWGAAVVSNCRIIALSDDKWQLQSSHDVQSKTRPAVERRTLCLEQKLWRPSARSANLRCTVAADSCRRQPLQLHSRHVCPLLIRV